MILLSNRFDCKSFLQLRLYHCNCLLGKDTLNIFIWTWSFSNYATWLIACSISSSKQEFGIAKIVLGSCCWYEIIIKIGFIDKLVPKLEIGNGCSWSFVSQVCNRVDCSWKSKGVNSLEFYIVVLARHQLGIKTKIDKTSPTTWWILIINFPFWQVIPAIWSCIENILGLILIFLWHNFRYYFTNYRHRRLEVTECPCLD